MTYIHLRSALISTTPPQGYCPLVRRKFEPKSRAALYAAMDLRPL